MLASDINENLSCLFLFVCFVFLQCNFSSFSQLFPQRDNHLVFKVYIVVFSQEATNEVQRLAKDIRPYAAVSDHVLHNSRRDDTTAFVTSW